jgi:hypothetical protein
MRNHIGVSWVGCKCRDNVREETGTYVYNRPRQIPASRPDMPQSSSASQVHVEIGGRVRVVGLLDIRHVVEYVRSVKGVSVVIEWWRSSARTKVNPYLECSYRPE